MRIAIVNHTHPVTGHVSALRMARFADELAKLGNTVLLITQAPAQPDDRSRQDIGASFAKLVAGLPPVLIECQLESAVLAGAARSGRLPFGLRQLVIGWAACSRRSIMARRRCPRQARPSGDVQRPSPSGPRCAMRLVIARTAAGFAVEVPMMPAIPHIVDFPVDPARPDRFMPTGDFGKEH